MSEVTVSRAYVVIVHERTDYLVRVPADVPEDQAEKWAVDHWREDGELLEEEEEVEAEREEPEDEIEPGDGAAS